MVVPLILQLSGAQTVGPPHRLVTILSQVNEDSFNGLRDETLNLMEGFNLFRNDLLDNSIRISS